MSLEQQNAPVQNGQGEEQNFDYRQGYEALRPEYTRITQEASELRNSLSEYQQLFAGLSDPDPEVQAAAAAALGLELDTGSDNQQPAGEFDDPLEQTVTALQARLDRIEQARELEAQTQEGQALDAMRDEFIGEAIGIIEQSVNQKFTEREEVVLANLAIAMAGADGVPDVQGAYNSLYGDESFLEDNRQRWMDSKSGAAVPPLGTSIPADKRPQTRSERIAYFDERVAQHENQG